ncbi:MAG: adenine phosphoribosyltransferase, partial [Clostridia bacterium]|nr:adenine phosphoribosyltransferase [Clostridia bacterium]
TLKVAGLERKLPVCPLNDKLSIAGFVLLGDYELTQACAKALLDKLPEHDYMIAPEAKSIGLINEMARLSGQKKHFVARKAQKAYMTNPLSVTVNSITTKGGQTLYLDSSDALLIKGKRIAIIDDVISLGDSIRAVEELVTKAGGTVVCRAAVLAEGDAADRDDIVYLEKLPLIFK